MSSSVSRNDPFESAASAARYYWSLGIEPIPLSSYREGPRRAYGAPITWTAQEIDRQFREIENVGLALGERSGNLIDVDLAWVEASLVSMDTMEDLPPFGRRSVRFSHRLAIGQLPNWTVRFKIPAAAAHLFNSKSLTVLALRGNRHLTMVPPSIHPSGERLQWEFGLDEVPKVDSDQLIRDAGLTAFLAVVGRVYPQMPRDRDDVCMALAAALLLAGHHAGDVDVYVERVAWIGGDEQFACRGNTANAALFRLWKGDDIGGLPDLCEQLGIEPMTDTLREWLGFDYDSWRAPGGG